MDGTNAEAPIQPAEQREIISSGREITVAALRFAPQETQGQPKEQRLVSGIRATLEANPNIDLLITPEYSLYYSPGQKSKEETVEGSMPTKTAVVPNKKRAPETFLQSLAARGIKHAEITPEEVKTPFVFTQQEDGTFQIEGGDSELIAALNEIVALAKEYHVNIALGTVCEQRIIDGHTVYHNTMLIINSEGQIVALRRKITETSMPELTPHEMSELGERFSTEDHPTDPDPVKNVYLQAETDARESLIPISLRTKKGDGDTFTLLPVICRERQQMREHLSRIEGGIDVVGVSIAEGDDRLEHMQELGETDRQGDEFQAFMHHFGFDLLAERHNSKGIFVMADSVGAAAGVYMPGSDKPISVQSASTAVIGTYNIG